VNTIKVLLSLATKSELVKWTVWH